VGAGLPRREILPGRIRTRQERLRRRASPDLRLLTEPARESRTIGSYRGQEEVRSVSFFSSLNLGSSAVTRACLTHGYPAHHVPICPLNRSNLSRTRLPASWAFSIWLPGDFIHDYSPYRPPTGSLLAELSSH
jgi:hypothetical protein